MTYDCMTAEELAAWTAAAEAFSRQHGWGASAPCTDCPLSFRMAERAAGRCHRSAPYTARGADRAEQRRAYSRDWMRRKRAARS